MEKLIQQALLGDFNIYADTLSAYIISRPTASLSTHYSENTQASVYYTL